MVYLGLKLISFFDALYMESKCIYLKYSREENNHLAMGQVVNDFLEYFFEK